MYDVKYAPFADSYIGMAHGDTYEHVKRWLTQRFRFVDTLFDYAPSYNNDVLTIRANTTELMTLEIETYTPVYQHLSWYNGQMDKKKIDGKVSVEFSGTAQAATDQEVLIYGGSNIKSIKGITSMNPNRMLIGSATKLVEIDAHDCSLLADINANKANLSPHEYLNKVNLSNCPLLEGNLRLNNSPLVQEIDIRGTNITGMNLPSSIRNLQVLKLPNTMTELTLNDAGMLHTLEFDEGVALQTVSMTNCNALNNVINFDLLQTPSITLNNSYNTAAELYFRDTTNLSLSNMSNLERVIFTPNNEYETFELINVANAPDYTVTTFNCPKLSTFMTTAPYRESYNNCGMTDKEVSIINWSEFNGNVSVLTDTVLRPATGLVESLSGNIATEFFIHVKEGENYTVTSDGGWLNIVGYDENKTYKKTISPGTDIKTYTFIADCFYIKIGSNGGSYITVQGLVGEESTETIQIKDYDSIQPNTTFTANSIDISSTQFTDVKLLCTTDTNTLKLPTTVKNFYCDSSFDLDTDHLEDGEYDVVHGELVEPYTTDYDGEVVRILNNETSLLVKDICTIPTTYINATTGEATYHASRSLSDFIEVVSGTQIKLNFWVCRVSEYNADKTFIKQTTLYNNGTQILILDSNCEYIRVHVEPSYLDDINVITCTPLVTYIPNLIPSSADGSLIFSMYAPSNAVAPASGTWDLHGLEFDNFHTFGMNNDVKVLVKKDVSKTFSSDEVTMLLSIPDRTSGGYNENGFGITTSSWNSGHWVSTEFFEVSSGASYTLQCTNSTYEVHIGFLDENKYIIERNVGTGNMTCVAPDEAKYVVFGGNYFYTSAPYTATFSMEGLANSIPMDDIEIKSISMPARYDDYNITIKNAYIKPTTHNTMLYPLLVNEDNPITGTLDYTDYAGKHLSWSFAYVNMNKVNIVQPKDELLNTYKYRYNTFYETEYEFDDPNEVLRYITSSSNLLPTFNEGFTYTYDKLDNNDGTYIYRIYANDPTLLTSFELERVPYLRITNAENLLSPIDLTKYETVSISESYYDITELYFREATNLTLTNMPYLERVIYLPNNEYEVFEIINVVNSIDYIITTSECPRLTTFMTTASHRESYNNEDVITEVITEFTNTDNELFTNEYVFSKTYWEEDGTEIQGSVNLLHYEIPSIEDSVKAIHMVQGLDSTNRVTFFNDDKFISCEVITTACELDFKLHRNCNRIVFVCEREGIVSSVVESILTTTLVKEYGSVEPNIIFNANTLDISNTQFTDVKLLCTTDLNTLKLPTTVKNFYCDSSFDLDTDYLEDGEYDVVHGELVEPYTTDYEGEVVRSKHNTILVSNDTLENIPAVGGTILTYTSNSTLAEFINQYDSNANLLVEYNTYTNNKTLDSATGLYKGSILLNSNTSYINIIAANTSEFKVTLTEPFTPNLIPSSADGSLIFSMYAPSKTIAPASNTWDLYGLEFDNFHTFGMNNDVQGDIGYIKVGNHSELVKQRGNISTESDGKFGDISVNEAERITIVGFELPTQESSPHVIITSNGKGYRVVTDADNDGTPNQPGYFYGSGNSYTWGSNNMHKFILELDGLDIEWINIDGVYYYMDKVRDLGIINPAPNFSYVVNLFDYATSFTKISEYSFKIDEIKSLSMPSRYNNYNVTIKNANISPKTHNTMLYPLLVNEDNPIEGTLDYTDYAGKHLSWSFAYTDEEYVNIIQPKDELLNSYEYKYNAFYDTEYEFDNPYEIARYTSSASGVLPTFNSEFTYTYDEIDNGDGTYTTKVYADSLDNLPTTMKFTYSDVIEILKWDASNVTNMYQMFYGCSQLEKINNIENLVTSNVTDISKMFYMCKVSSLDLSKWDTSNVTNMEWLFRGCANLTDLDLSGFDTANVADMNNMFNGCNNLTSLDVSGFETSKVSNMSNMFNGCSKLTSLDVSKFDTSNITAMNDMFSGCNGLTSLNLSNFDTTKATNMQGMFYNCNGLTSLDVSGFDTTNVTNINSMFFGCGKLTSLDLSGFDTSNVTTMQSTFYLCSSLTEVKGIENWDCSKVTKFGSMFQGATAFGGDLDLRNWKIGQNATVTEIFGFMNGCANLKSVDMSGWVIPDGTNFANFMANQGSLHTVRVIGWSATNIQNLCGVVGWYVGGTIYGDVIIDETYLINDWVYDNALIIAKYTANATGVLPGFNTDFTGYTTGETDNGDGTYTVSIATDSVDNLPTMINFHSKSSIITIDKLNTTALTTMRMMFQSCTSLTEIKGLNNFKTTGIKDMLNLFYGCSSLSSLDISSWDTSSVEIMGGMFDGCTKLTSLDVSGFNTSKVTNMNGMFVNCSNLTTLDVSNFDTSNVTTMSAMFKNCNKLIALNVSNFNTSKVTTMSEMFSGCNVLSIEGLGNWDVKNVTDIGSMFLHCRGITSLLEISDWDTSSLKSLYRTFMGCTELIELDVSNWNASKFEVLTEAFYSCAKIISFNLGNWDCRRVISISSTFFGCSSLSSIILPKEVGKGCNATSALRNCTNLKEIALPKGIGNIASMLSNCYNLEKAIIPLDDITDVQDSTFNNCRTLVNIDWVGDLSNNFNIISTPGEYVTTESDVHELMTNLGDLKKDKIKISLSKGIIKVNDTEKTIE